MHPARTRDRQGSRARLARPCRSRASHAKGGNGGFAPEPGAWARRCMTDWRTDDDDDARLYGSLGKAAASICAHPHSSAACHACHCAARTPFCPRRSMSLGERRSPVFVDNYNDAQASAKRSYRVTSFIMPLLRLTFYVPLGTQLADSLRTV